jgi:hypothetical protein
MAAGEPTLTLRDVAQLAGVQRAVVSMWRRRPRARGQDLPFPAPVPSSGAHELFSRDEVVTWLDSTGRGKNADHRLDAPALSVPPGASLEDLVTLLCLRTSTEDDLDAARLEELACGVDPHDEFLLSESRGLTVTDDLLRFVEELVEASFGPAEALGRLEAGPTGRAFGRREFADNGTELLHAVAQTAVLHLGGGGVPIAFSGGPPSLALALASDAGRLIVAGSGVSARALRRRALLHGLDSFGHDDGPLLRVLSLPGSDSDGVLGAVDDLLLELAPGEVALIIASAGKLCDRLQGEEERQRSALLRPRQLTAALRLPRGLWKQAHRQALGVWICEGGRSTDRPPMAGDLGAYPANELSADDLAADVFAALSAADGRAYRYLRPVDLPAILAGAPVVPPGTRALRWGTAPDDHLTRVLTAALITAAPPETFDVLVSASQGAILLRQRSLAELHEQRAVRVHRRSRIDRNHGDPNGTVAVLTADGTMDDVMMDPFDAERHYPRAHRTEAGDVVFIDGAKPQARVDARGGSLVASPSRILRPTAAAGIGPYTLAALINHRLPAGEWQTWNVPQLEPNAAASLESVLAEAGIHDNALRRRQDALHDLVTALVDGVAAGAVTVEGT